MPFFSNDKREERLKTVKIIKVSVLGRGGIFIYFRPRDLGFPRIIKLELSLLFEKGLKKGNISWEKD
jgi:hypothetical protein